MKPSVDIRNVIVSTFKANKVPPLQAKEYEKELYNKCSSKENYIDMAYDKIGELSIRDDKILKKDEGYGWEAPHYEPYKSQYERKIFQSNLKIDPIKGMYTCHSCKSDEFYIWLEQRNSGDEGMTTVRQCSKCGKRGKER